MIAVEALPLFEAEAAGRRRELGHEASERQRDRAGAAVGVAGRTVQTAKAIQRREMAPIIWPQVERDRRSDGRDDLRRGPRLAAARMAPHVRGRLHAQGCELDGLAGGS
jgi:hypothetical protein